MPARSASGHVETPLGMIVKVEGRELADESLMALTQVRVRRSLGTIGRATVRFMAAEFEAAGWYKLGAQVELHAFDGPVLFRGEVTGIEFEHTGGGPPELIVTVDDPIYKMAASTVSRTFLNQGYADIISTLISDHGLSPEVTVTGGQPEYTLQSGTDLEFLDAVSRRTDCAWSYDPTSQKVRVARPAVGTAVLTLGIDDDLHRLSVRASARNAGEVTVRGWDPKKGVAVEAKNETLPSAESELVTAYPGRTTTARTTRVVTGLGPTTVEEAKQLATSLARDARSEAVTLRGTTTLAGLLNPGDSVRITSKPVVGTYLVTEVEHLWDPDGAYTTFVAGSHRPSGLVDVLGGERPDSGFRMDNLVAAVVVDVADEKKLGQVKVRYPVPKGGGTDVVSHWARTLSLGGGPKRGMMFIPEIDDEVLVAFEGGDTRRPVVLGGLFSESRGLPENSDKTEAVKSSKVNYRRIASRSGNLVEMSDEDGKEHLLIAHGTARHSLKMDKDNGLVIDVKDAPIKITNGKGTIEITKTGDITIKGESITLTGNKDIALKATGKLAAKGTAGASLEGAKVDVKADSAGSVQAGGPLTIKGAMVAIN